MRKKNQKGAAAVEFAIVIPFLLLILFAIIEFSILLYDKAMLTNASREGARAGIVFVQDRETNLANVESSIDAAVNNYCASHLISFGSGSTLGINKTWTDTNSSNANYMSGDTLKVEVTYTFNWLVFSKLVSFLGGMWNDVFNLNAVTVMRLE